MAESGDGDTLVDPGGAIAALRAQGAHGFDPVRFRFIEALARRASTHAGDARCMLDGKLAKALSDYEARFEKARVEAGNTLGGMVDRFPAAADDLRRFYITGDFSGLRRLTTHLEGPSHRGRLADLVRHIAQPSPEQGGGSPAPVAAADAGSSAELKTLRYFRSTWSKLGVDQRLNQALAKLPENAGPLNSHVLALRALKLMRDISPAYLNRFMSYLETLRWLDQANGGAVPVQKDAVRSDGDRKRKVVRKKSG